MDGFKRITKLLKRTTVIATMIGALVSLGAIPATYFLVWKPEIDSAQVQNQLLKEQNTFLRQQISILNETLKLQKVQNQILQESLLRKAVVTVSAYPAYSWHFVEHGDGTIEVEKLPLTISQERSTVFHVYVSNVGTGVTQLFYLMVVVTQTISNSTWTGLEPAKDLGGVVMKPYDTMNFTYTFDPKGFLARHTWIGSPIQIVFAVVSTETTSYFSISVLLE